ncbi:MAG TPA: cupin [Ramlibacter sp.]|nr:cupin [Ramlibacter sp.]
MTATHETPAAAPQIARWSELKPAARAFLDSHIPAYEKENFRVIGPGVNEDPASRPVIRGSHGFSVGYARIQPGRGAALHSHRTLEVFVPLNGPLTVVYGAAGEHEATVQAWDTVSVPVGLMRGFRNPNDYPLVMMAIIQDGAAGPERVEWHPSVVEQAGRAGVGRDAQGNLLPIGQAA